VFTGDVRIAGGPATRESPLLQGLGDGESVDEVGALQVGDGTAHA